MSIEMLPNVIKFEGHLIRDNGDVYRNHFGEWVKVQRVWNTDTKRMEVTFNNEVFDLAELVYFVFKGCYDEEWFELAFKDGNRRNCRLENITIHPKDEEAYKEHIFKLNIERLKKEYEEQNKRAREERERKEQERREERERRKKNKLKSAEDNIDWLINN